MAVKQNSSVKTSINELPLHAQSESNCLEWLDLLVHFTLNPEKSDVKSITRNDEARIVVLLEDESIKLRNQIHHQIFSVHTKNEAELLTRNYHATLTMMLSQAFNNKVNLPEKKCPAGNIIAELISFFEEMISFIEARFAMYLSLDEYVPKTYFKLAQKELSKRLRKLQSKIDMNNPQKVPFEIIVNKLNRFLNTNEFESTTSYKNIIYKKKLITEVEKVDFSIKEFQGYTTIDSLLIYLNFNSVEYINYLLSFITKKISCLVTEEEKTKQLYFLYKSFNQLHKRPDICYNQNFHSVEVLLNNWFIQELSYQEKIQAADSSFPVVDGQIKKQCQEQDKRNKILCILSSDQIGLILRAADEQRVLVAKSMSEVFKRIVPSLSTPVKENLSYDGMRSKSYVAEERDKKIAIETLEQIISKIREY